MLFILLLGPEHIAAISSPEFVTSTNVIFNTATDYINADNPTITVAGHPIALWQQDGVYYAFLPAACKKNPKLLSDFPEEADHTPIVWMYSDNIPSVFIDISSDISETINNNKEIKESGMITVLDPNGKISLQQPLEYIKGRGNSSYLEFDKKPYQIKLKDSVPFLGMQKGKRWVFNSNTSDPSLLRNALARNLANHLDLTQSDPGVFVDLYLNGEYVGNYYVTEKVEVRKNRLSITDLEKATEIVNNQEDLGIYETAWTEKTKAKDIPNDPEDITGGYLIERDFNARFLKEVEDNGSYFITEANECFILRSPEYASENQLIYINNYVQNVENAILSPDGIDPVTGKYYTELIDLDSFVRKYLLEEITANYDGGVASSFFYKDSDRIDDKLYAGPIWDYDVSFGNTPAYQGHLYDEPDRLTRLCFNPDASSWFPALYGKPEFYEVVSSCYKDKISSHLMYISETILPELADTIAASAEMDRTRWQKQYLENDGGNTFKDSIAFLSDYITGRKAFLDRVWIEKEPFCQITLYIEDASYDIFTVFEGEPLPEFPTPEITYANFHGWVSEDGSFPDHTTPVYSDMTFHAYLE